MHTRVCQLSQGNSCWVDRDLIAPRVGFEPTTLILTGFRATAAPPGNIQLLTFAIISSKIRYFQGFGD